MTSGILYVIVNKWIRNPETNEMPYKIGVTKNTVEDRYYGLGLKMPGKFETLFAYKIDNYTEAEKSIHSIFNKHRINGEWFNLSNGDIEFIRNICLKMGGELVTDEIEEEVEAETNEATTNTLESLLRTIGKSTFVKYYEHFKNKSLQDVKHLMKISEDYAENSLNTKSSVGKKIFKEGLEKSALEKIIKSSNVDEETREKATELLNKNGWNCNSVMVTDTVLFFFIKRVVTEFL